MGEAQEPEFHFMVLAPGLQASWFFEAARRYWQLFRPIVLEDTDLIRLVPADRSTGITVLARSDTAPFLRERLQQDYPYAFLDILVHDDIAAMQAALDARADAGRRFE